MKIIGYEPNSKNLPHLQKQLVSHNFQVLAATDNLERVRDLAGEFAAPLGILGPETLEFMRSEAEIRAAFPLPQPPTFPSSLDLMQSLGQPPRFSEALWRAAATMASERYESGMACVHAGMHLQSHCPTLPYGYETLPASWLVGLPGLIQSILPAWQGAEHLFILAFQIHGGVLDIAFAGENLPEIPGPTATHLRRLRTATRRQLNRRLYPSRWGRLLTEHAHDIALEHPELRTEIERIQ